MIGEYCLWGPKRGYPGGVAGSMGVGGPVLTPVFLFAHRIKVFRGSSRSFNAPLRAQNRHLAADNTHTSVCVCFPSAVTNGVGAEPVVATVADDAGRLMTMGRPPHILRRIKDNEALRCPRLAQPEIAILKEYDEPETKCNHCDATFFRFTGSR